MSTNNTRRNRERAARDAVREPPKTPDFTDLLKRDLIAYCKGRGLTTEDANKQALELLEFVEREASKFT